MESTHEVKEVAFRLFSPQAVREIAATEITEHKLDISDRNTVNQSLYASLLGPIQNHIQCPYCSLSTPDCTGHYGFIEFPTKRNGEKVRLLHEGHRGAIIATLASTCNKCSTPLLKEGELEVLGIMRLKGVKRLRRIAKEAVKQRNCRASDGRGTCNYVNPVFISKEKGNYVRYHERKEGKSAETAAITNMPRMSPETIYRIFRNISPEHAALLGFAPAVRPEFMIMENLLVIPPAARPPRALGDRVTHNDITNLYSDIVRTCNGLRNIELSAEERELESLYNLVSRLFDNSKKTYRYTNGKSHITFKCMISGKGRLIRGHTQGKRVDFCIRSVASPDPNLRLSQVRIPRMLAEIATYPEIVDQENYTRLQRYMDEGKVVQITRRRHSSRKEVVLNVAGMQDKTLQLGDVVNRWLMGARVEDGVFYMGDVILINRQPTLHKMSMMGMEVVIGEDLTIGMPVNAAAPFGLDFDGDELNIGL